MGEIARSLDYVMKKINIEKLKATLCLHPLIWREYNADITRTLATFRV